MTLHQSPSTVIARARQARGYCPEMIRQHIAYMDVKCRLEPPRIALIAPSATPAPEENPVQDDKPAPSKKPAPRKSRWGRFRRRTCQKIVTSLRKRRRAALDAILAGAPSRERPPIAVSIFKSHAERAKLRQVEAVAIVQETADAYGLTVEDMIGASRLQEVTEARQEAMYRMRRELVLSFEDISLVLRRLDHTTSRWGCASYAKRLAALKAKIEART